jgi:hypothetical protein
MMLYDSAHCHFPDRGPAVPRCGKCVAVVFPWWAAVEQLEAPGIEGFAVIRSRAGFHDDVHGFAITEAKFDITVNQATHFELNDAEIIPGRSNGLSWVLRRVPYSQSRCTIKLSSGEECEPM